MGIKTDRCTVYAPQNRGKSVERATLWLVQSMIQKFPAILANKFRLSFFGHINEPINYSQNDFERLSDLEAPLIEESDIEVCYIYLQDRSKYADKLQRQI